MTKEEYEFELKIEAMAREYCLETGSFIFDYTEESNELTQAFKAGFFAALEEVKNAMTKKSEDKSVESDQEEEGEE